MTEGPTPMRTFDSAVASSASRQLGERSIVITPAVEATEGGPLSAYSARFGAGERAELPAPYEEVWIVISGLLRLGPAGAETTVGPGQFVHVPEHSPGHVEAVEATVLVSVSVPPH